MVISERLRLPPGATVMHIARRKIVDNTVVSYSERYLQKGVLPSLVSDDLTTVPFLHKLLVDQSEYPLLRAEIEIEAHLLTSEEAQLLRTEAGESAIAISRMTYTAPNKPAVWYRGLFKTAYHLGVEIGNALCPD
jgi:DNA-binding GntR family transcriptional regulator